jgi:uncharacterized protein YxeA
MDKKSKIVIALIVFVILVLSFLTIKHVVKLNKNEERIKDEVYYAEEDNQDSSKEIPSTEDKEDGIHEDGEDEKSSFDSKKEEDVVVLDRGSAPLNSYELRIKEKVYIGEYEEAYNICKEAKKSKSLSDDAKQKIDMLEEDVVLVNALEEYAGESSYKDIMENIKDPELYLRAFYLLKDDAKLRFVIDKKSLVPSLFDDFNSLGYEEVEDGKYYEVTRNVYNSNKVYRVRQSIEPVEVYAMIGVKENGSLYLYGIYSDSELANNAFFTREQLEEKNKK